jgi:hypothetical protein
MRLVGTLRLVNRYLARAAEQRIASLLIGAFWVVASSGALADESITLVWNPSPSPDAAGCAVYYGTVSGSYDSRIDAGTNTVATVTNLSTGLTYYFAVATYDTDEFESIPSNEVSYSATGTPPAISSVVVRDGQLKITWDSIPGQAYQVQSTTNLNQCYWQSIDSVITADANSASVMEPLGPEDQRFYRLMLVPATLPPIAGFR